MGAHKQPKQVFGNIPGIPIFATWDNRKECSKSGAHRPPVAGIWGNKMEGVSSIVLSDGYEDDQDDGDIITYTGMGGKQKDPENFPNSGPQSEPQSWDITQNRGLMRSLTTRNPIRVIRSSKCPSIYGPNEGCRFDGLYTITSCWSEIGNEGYRICRCRLERVAGQPPIPTRPHYKIPTSRKRQRRTTPPSLIDRRTRSRTESFPTFNSGKLDLDVELGQAGPSTLNAGSVSGGSHRMWERAETEQARNTQSANTDSVSEGSEHQPQEHITSKMPIRAEPAVLQQLNAVMEMLYPWVHKQQDETLLDHLTDSEEDEDEDQLDNESEEDATLMSSKDGRADAPQKELAEGRQADEKKYLSGA